MPLDVVRHDHKNTERTTTAEIHSVNSTKPHNTPDGPHAQQCGNPLASGDAKKRSWARGVKLLLARELARGSDLTPIVAAVPPYEPLGRAVREARRRSTTASRRGVRWSLMAAHGKIGANEVRSGGRPPCQAAASRMSLKPATPGGLKELQLRIGRVKRGMEPSYEVEVFPWDTPWFGLRYRGGDVPFRALGELETQKTSSMGAENPSCRRSLPIRVNQDRKLGGNAPKGCGQYRGGRAAPRAANSDEKGGERQQEVVRAVANGCVSTALRDQGAVQHCTAREWGWVEWSIGGRSVRADPLGANRAALEHWGASGAQTDKGPARGNGATFLRRGQGGAGGRGRGQARYIVDWTESAGYAPKRAMLGLQADSPPQSAFFKCRKQRARKAQRTVTRTIQGNW
ncbi:hypothetical protein B0H17DRAFT_1182055 [Mycena rosella]|uniref:Uncharacterized protein n=1 Tax=Mycena rosella TaxID=1033263 RepID=A0AAD7D676_MYCRO|nr:hypothetical protein B0H17DRAFT_1182055 [Mycena rosella]